MEHISKVMNIRMYARVLHDMVSADSVSDDSVYFVRTWEQWS